MVWLANWFLAGFLLPTVALAGDRLVLSSFDSPGLTSVAASILKKSYGELGIEVQVIYAEAGRSLVDAAAGITDGEVARIKRVGDKFPTLLRVDIPVVTLRTYAYTTRPDLQGKTIEQLKSLRAGHVRGAVFAQTVSRGFADVWTADDPIQLFRMLEHNRVDVVFAKQMSSEEILKRFGLTTVVQIKSTLTEFPFYHFLNEKHRDLVPQIKEVFFKNGKYSEQ